MITTPNRVTSHLKKSLVLKDSTQSLVAALIQSPIGSSTQLSSNRQSQKQLRQSKIKKYSPSHHLYEDAKSALQEQLRSLDMAHTSNQFVRIEDDNVRTASFGGVGSGA